MLLMLILLSNEQKKLCFGCPNSGVLSLLYIEGLAKVVSI